MVGCPTSGFSSCIGNFGDEETDAAAVWMQMGTWVGGHHMRSSSAMRFNKGGDKIAGYHMIYDTYQVFDLQELLAQEGAQKELPQTPWASASSIGRAVGGLPLAGRIWR